MNQRPEGTDDAAGHPVPRPLLTPVEAAAALGISRSKLFELMAEGRVASVRVAGCRRVPVAALAAFIDSLATPPT